MTAAAGGARRSRISKARSSLAGFSSGSPPDGQNSCAGIFVRFCLLPPSSRPQQAMNSALLNSAFPNHLNALRGFERRAQNLSLRKPELVHKYRVSSHRRGVRVVTCAGRDAMDASGARRRHAACGRRSRVVLSPRRRGQALR
jgi:hypothetical protein